MSDPDDIPRARPQRADPVQPDKPGSGNDSGNSSVDRNLGTNGNGGTSADPGAGARNPGGAHEGDDERSDASLKNLREGYGGKSTDDHTDDPSMAPNRPASDAQ